MKLRPYQQKMIDEARVKLRIIRAALKAAKLERGPRLLLQCPTGGGKTAVSGFITKSAVERGSTVRFLCHRDFLVEQTSGTYAKLDLQHSFIAAGRRFNPYTPVHIGMVQSIKSRLAKIGEPDICIWDEAHHIGAAGWSAIQAAWPMATHIGLTATPIRLDGKGLDAWFDDIVLGPSVHWLIEAGYLSDYRAFAPSAPDLTALHTRMGEYIASEVDALMDRTVIIGDMVRHYRQYAAGKKSVYFCTSIAHSQHTAAAFQEAGFRFIHLDGSHNTWERKAAAKAMARGEIDGFTNVDLFGEGFDLAAQADMDVTIECVGMARPTQSLALFMQQVGRALRPKPDKAVILDHAGNIAKHGLPDDDREWSLAGVQKKESQVIQCQGCGAMVPAQTLVCRHCGERLREVQARMAMGGGRFVEQEDGDLQEIDKDAARKARKAEEWQAESFDELVAIGRKRGYDNPEKWAGFLWTKERAKKMADKIAARNAQLDFYQRLAIERYGS